MTSKYDGMQLRELLHRFIFHSIESRQWLGTLPSKAEEHYALMEAIALELVKRCTVSDAMQQRQAEQQIEIGRLNRRLTALEQEA